MQQMVAKRINDFRVALRDREIKNYCCTSQSSLWLLTDLTCRASQLAPEERYCLLSVFNTMTPGCMDGSTTAIKYMVSWQQVDSNCNKSLVANFVAFSTRTYAYYRYIRNSYTQSMERRITAAAARPILYKAHYFWVRLNRQYFNLNLDLLLPLMFSLLESYAYSFSCQVSKQRYKREKYLLFVMKLSPPMPCVILCSWLAGQLANPCCYSELIENCRSTTHSKAKHR